MVNIQKKVLKTFLRSAIHATDSTLIGCKAKKIGKSDLPNFKGLLNSLGWMVHEDMDDEIVTEIVRVIYENAGEFGNYHAIGKGITPDTIGGLPVPKEEYHPAVVKFLESKGKKVGR